MQRSEQEIRKHIRIEQQMKLYTDSLEEKIEDMQERIQSQKGFIEGLKFEKEELKTKLRLVEQQGGGHKPKSRSRINT